jgi:PGF-pre-PGF domain-containing protein
MIHDTNLRSITLVLLIITLLAYPVQADPAEPVLLSLTSDTSNGTYGIGSPITINATYDEVLKESSWITVVLNNSVSLTLSAVSSGILPTHAASIVTGTDSALINTPHGITISGNYAYIASYVSDALEIIDISNPTDPSHAGSIIDGEGGALLNGANNVFASANYAYVISSGGNALEIVNVTNPANPVHEGNITDGEGGAFLNGVQDVFVQGDYAYVTAYWDDSLEIVNVTDPAKPVHESSIADGEGGALLNGAQGVFVQGDYAYVVSSLSDALEIVDISDPTNPLHEGSIADGEGGALLNGAQGVFVQGNYAYVISSLSNALEIIDLSDATSPSHSGSVAHGAGGALLQGPRGVFVSGGYAYVTALGNDALEIVNVTDPANPVHKSAISHSAGGALLDGAYDIFVSGDYAFVTASASNALEIINTKGATISGTYSVSAGQDNPLLNIESITSQHAEDPNSNTNTSTTLPATNIADDSAIVIDATRPVITISAPTKTAATHITDTTICITDALGISAANVTVDTLTTAGYADFTTIQTSSTRVDCTIDITSSGDLFINATDNTGNTNSSTEAGYIIDAIAPAITISAPTKTSTATITDTTISITDAVGINATNVTVNESTTAVYADFTTVQTSATQVDCTISITSSGDLLIDAHDNTGNANSSTETGYIISSSPSGGDGGRTTVRVAAGEDIPAGGEATLTFERSSITAIHVTAGENKIPDILITVNKIAGKPSGVEDSNTSVFEYYDITLYKATDLDLADSLIDFFVPESILDQKGWNPSDIVMLRWHDGAWESLETHLIQEELDTFHYYAITPGFSYFAIAYGENKTIDDRPSETPAEEEKEESPTHPNTEAIPTIPIHTTSPEPTPTPLSPLTSISAVVMGIAGWPIISRKTKK